MLGPARLRRLKQTEKPKMINPIQLTEEELRAMTGEELKAAHDEASTQSAELSAQLADISEKLSIAQRNWGRANYISRETRRDIATRLEVAQAAGASATEIADIEKGWKENPVCGINPRQLNTWNANIGEVVSTWSGYLPAEANRDAGRA